jgi:hypothetical protein
MRFGDGLERAVADVAQHGRIRRLGRAQLHGHFFLDL